MIEVKFPSILEQYGVTRDKETQSIKKLIKEFDDAYREYEELYKEYESAEDDEEKAELYADIEAFESDLEEADEAIVEKIHHWQKNKDVWAANSQRMAEGRKNAQAQSQPQPQPSQAPQQTPKSQPTQVPNNLGVEPEKEKKNSDGWLIFGALALVVTLGAVNMFKK
jgi:hypothetical protein